MALTALFRRQAHHPDSSGAARRHVPAHSEHADHSVFPLDVGLGEWWALERVRRHGVPAFIGIMTVAAIAASLVLVVISLLVLDGFSDTEHWVRSFVVGTLAAAVVAVPLLLVSARLVSHLDAATQLLQESAISDPLTGVSNRRGFFAALDAIDGTQEITVGMVDIDDFKAINDRHGHSTGDTVLCMVAAWLEQFVGELGTVGRLGGDEFAYLAVVDPERPSPARHDFRLGEVEFSVSIGHARAQDGDLHAALLAADADLYRQKQTRPAPTRPVIRSGPR